MSEADTSSPGPDSYYSLMVRCNSYNFAPDALGHATANKRAVEALTIMFFIFYVVLTIAAHVLSIIKKDHFLAYATKKLMNEIAYKYWYIFFMFAMYHVISPWAFPTIMLWIQAILMLIHFVMHFVFGRNRKFVLFITYALMNLCAVVLSIIILSDNWC